MIPSNLLTLLLLLAGAVSAPEAQAAGDAERGRQVAEQSCVPCHAVAGARNPRAPPFQTIVRRPGRSDDYLRGFLEDDHFPMVMHGLIERDKEDVLEYFRSVRRRR
jgi:cytochrome c553